MFESSREVIFIFSSVIALVSLLIGFIIYFVLRYRRRQEEFEKEKQRILLEKENVIMRAQIEIGEQIMTDIATEIHDNIGAALSIAKISVHNITPENLPDMQAHSLDLLTTAITDLRSLSKNLHGKYIEETGFQEALNRLVLNVNRSGKSRCELHYDMEKSILGEGQDIILFRCIQEAVNNALKHSGANLIRIRICMEDSVIRASVEDNGAGLTESKTESIGFRSMRERMEKVGGNFYFQSLAHNGCKIALTIPIKNSSHAS